MSAAFKKIKATTKSHELVKGPFVPGEILDRIGLKKTEFRLELLNLFYNAKGPLSALHIFELLSKHKNAKRLDFDRATLFRNLKNLVQKSVLYSTEFGTGASYFSLRAADRHNHFIFCTKCEVAEAIDYCGIAPMIERASQRGFSVSSHRFELIGLCSSCK
jgi:Fur family ferric uptake transcriptional regulator